MAKIFKYLFIISCVLGGVVVGGILYFGIDLYRELSPKVEKIVNYKPNEVTQVFDTKNRLVANIFENEFRYYAKYDEIPGHLVEALLAVEDTTFFEHEGVNIDAILRAGIKNTLSMRYSEGGSTLTQQLVKNMLLTRDRKISRKIKEMLLAIRTEQVLSKEDILERYLNYIYLGHGYFGVKAAANGYFKKSLHDLSLKEIAMLVSLPKSPIKYDPTKNNAKDSLQRANSILKRMFDLGWISNVEYKKSIREIPTIYNETLTQNKAPYAVDEMLRTLDIPDLKRGGYKIYLTIDLDYEEAAKNSLTKGYDNIKFRIQDRIEKYRKRKKLPQLSEEEIKILNDDNTLNGAMIVTRPSTGEILALIGGVNYNKSSFNRVTQTNRQFGSAIKPFVYEIALNNGYSTATQIPDSPLSFKDGNKVWQPHNFNRKYNGFVSLQYALENSLNIPTINLARLVGMSKIYSGLSSFGFKNFEKDPSVVLGSLSLSPLQASYYYSIFANYGVSIKPYLVSKVVDRSGNIVYESEPTQDTLSSPEQTYLVTSILQNVVKRGTGSRARVNGVEIAGKTGTTNNIKDAWFCGFAPDIEAIVWYGRDDNTQIGSNEFGGAVAAPVFSDFLTQVLKINPELRRTFTKPKNVFSRKIDGEDYLYTDKSMIPTNNVIKEDEMIF